LSSHKKTKKFAIRPVQGANSDINVTPLVDVVLVLLIIFMVVTPLLEKDIPVRTPASEQVEQADEVPQDQIIVYLNKDGDLRINNEKVTGQEFSGKLKRILDPRASADKVVFIVADDACNYAKLIRVLDSARAAGAEVLGFATDPPDPSMFL
jgi:biopolymer transport protein TolR